jgi:hypothetical protein
MTKIFLNNLFTRVQINTMQIQGSKRGDKRSIWLFGYRLYERYHGCIMSLCLNKFKKGKRCVTVYDRDIILYNGEKGRQAAVKSKSLNMEGMRLISARE